MAATMDYKLYHLCSYHGICVWYAVTNELICFRKALLSLKGQLEADTELRWEFLLGISLLMSRALSERWLCVDNKELALDLVIANP